MVDQPTLAVGVFHWGFRIVGGQMSDQSGGDRHIPTDHALEQRHPRFLPRPASREMQRQLAGGVGDPCGNRNYLVSDGAGGRFNSDRSPVSVAAALVRLNAMTAQTSYAALAQKCADGMCARAEFFRSACACSMIACRR